MKFTVLGFSQQKLIELGLDLTDALILRYFVDFKDSGEMVMEIVNNKPFYWINYTELIKNIPVIGVTTNIGLRRRLKKMQDCNILEHYHKNQGGSYSFYALGNRYKELIKYKQEDYKGQTEKFKGQTEKFKGLNQKDKEGQTEKFKGLNSKDKGGQTEKFKQNINLLKDTSIKDTSIKNIYSNVIENLNSKAGTSYKDTSRKTQDYIKARLNEGFKEEDFYVVIDNKCREWKGTDYEKYLRPGTLFGPKFEEYLNQKINNTSKSNSGSNMKSNNNGSSNLNFCNYGQRNYNYGRLEEALTGQANYDIEELVNRY